MSRQPTKFTARSVDSNTLRTDSNILVMIKGPGIRDVSARQANRIARFVEGVLNATNDMIGFDK